MEFCEEYPNRPPRVKFLSKMFHPNIYADGGICLDILRNKWVFNSFYFLTRIKFYLLLILYFSRWSPTYDVSAILTSIQSLLSDPNPNSPANSMAAQLFKENRREYEKRVKACVEQSWCDDWYFPSKFGGSKTFSIKKSPTSKIRYDLILPTRVYYLGNLISNSR